MHSLTRIIALTLGSGTLLGQNIVLAQDVRESSTSEVALEEIIVTAERRTSDVQKTATSVSVLNGENLLQSGRTQLSQILEDTPGVTASNPGNSDVASLSITIRGVQNNANTVATAAAPSATTATYTDGIYEGVGGGYDIERIEVLRGPQGTLYGRSATSGVVATYTRNPTFDAYGGDAAVELGNYSLQHYTGAFNAPITEKFALRVAADHYQRDGYYSDEGGALQRTSGRVKLLYKPIEDLSILVGGAFEENTLHTGGVVGYITAPPDTFTYATAPVLKTQNSHRQYWTTIDWNLGAATLTYQGSYRNWLQGRSDAHWAYQNFTNPIDPTGAQRDASQSRVSPLDQFITHELRLTSNADSGVKWIVGAISYNNRLHRYDEVALINPGPSGSVAVTNDTRKEVQDWGGFGEVTIPLTDALRLTAGARYDYTYVQSLVNQATDLNVVLGCPFGPCLGVSARSVGPDEGTQRFYNKTYKLRLEQDLTSQNLLYAMISSGFLPGDVQVAGGPNPTGAPGGVPVAYYFDPATLTAYEVGSKNRFLDNTLQVNGSLYYYRYEGYQQIIAINGQVDTSVLYSVPVTMRGGELEVLYQITENGRLGLNYGGVDARYGDKPGTFAGQVTQKHVTGVVPQTISLSYDHIFHLPGDSTFNAHADVRQLAGYSLSGLSASQISAGRWDYAHADSEVVGNVSATWAVSANKYSVTGYVRNVADNRYKTSALLSTQITGTQYDPRTYGLILSVRL